MGENEKNVKALEQCSQILTQHKSGQFNQTTELFVFIPCPSLLPNPRATVNASASNTVVSPHRMLCNAGLWDQIMQ